MKNQSSKILSHPNIESREDLFDGALCIKGTRISVAFLLDALASGISREELQIDYGLSYEVVDSVLKFAAERFKEVNVAS